MRKELIKDKLLDVLDSIDIIDERFKQINEPDDFVKSAFGSEKLDSITMRLQVVGKIISKPYKMSPNIFSNYPEIIWKDIIGLRNIISHEYHNVDHTITYSLCKEHLPRLKENY